jgi:hypothetical protein
MTENPAKERGFCFFAPAVTSMGVVPLRLRQLVGVVTAAFVLLAGVYCACAQVAQTVAGADAVPACHAHRAGNKAAGRDHSPAPNRELPCQHCKRLVSVTSAAANDAGTLHPVPWPWAVPATSGVAPAVAVAWHDVALALDLPPPQPGRSLLSLHCALNT